MKTTKIIYWITTGLIALSSISGIFMINTKESLEGMQHLGLPVWFAHELAIGKCIGGIVIILPFISKRIKEWVYTAFGIDMLSAFIAYASVDGFLPKSFSPLIFFVILIVSYITYHKLQSANAK
jgi:hypothetical protein